MTYTISLVHRANIHLVKAIEWCENESPGLELKFLKLLDSNIKYIQKNPLKSQIRYGEVRIKFFKDLKFGIHYILRKNHIFIVGIFHTNQDSENW